MHEVWLQQLQCYRTRNVSVLRLKYTCFYLCSVRIVYGPMFRIFSLRPYAKTERKLNVSLADIIRCCPFTQGHSGLFCLLVVFILRFVKTGTPTLSFHSPIFGRIQRLKKSQTRRLFVQIFSQIIRESFLHYFQVTKVFD